MTIIELCAILFKGSIAMSHSSDKDSTPLLYVLTGDPKPLARCRISGNKTGGRRCYDSQKELKLILSITLKSQHNDRPQYQGPLHMDISFYFHIPKTHKNTRNNDYMYYKPDLDNCLKLYSDLCVYAGLFHDDASVCSVQCKKVYSNNPRTEFTIRELNNGKN